jgi:hypothetical protein
MAGEEVFLRGLYELVSGANKHEIEKVFRLKQELLNTSSNTCTVISSIW